MKLIVLGSGSRGNSYVIQGARGTQIMVDCGFSFAVTKQRMSDCGLDFKQTKAIFFTHDHSDHCGGAAVFHRKVPSAHFFANGNTADAIASRCGINDGWEVFETADRFEFEEFMVTTFSVPHDASDPVGYVFNDGDASLFIGTDMGCSTFAAQVALADADCAILESNHDPVLLETSNRSWSLKQRIAGRSGHLANEESAELFREASPSHLKHLLLAHLSEECNSPSLARAAFTETIREMGLDNLSLEILSQNETFGPIEF